MFGDSVTEEVIFDLVILMSGIAKKEAELDAFINKSTNMDILIEHSRLIVPHSSIEMDFYHGRRNHTIFDPERLTRIRHRFTGHISLKANGGGISTFYREE